MDCIRLVRTRKVVGKEQDGVGLNSVLIERIRGVHLADLDIKSWFIGGANTPCYRKHEAQDKHVETDA